ASSKQYSVCASVCASPEERFWDAAKTLAEATPPPPAVERLPLELRPFAAICAAAQILTADEPFILSCRRAGKLLGCHYRRAYELLVVLVNQEILEIAERGDGPSRLPPRKANRYKFIGAPPPDPPTNPLVDEQGPYSQRY